MKRFISLVAVLALVLSTSAAFAAEWTGTISKGADGKTWFKSGENNLAVTNPEKATGFEGKSVKVNGTADSAAKTVTIESVTLAS